MRRGDQCTHLPRRRNINLNSLPREPNIEEKLRVLLERRLRQRKQLLFNGVGRALDCDQEVDVLWTGLLVETGSVGLF